jgi:hypothetical protein
MPNSLFQATRRSGRGLKFVCFKVLLAVQAHRPAVA